MLTRVTGVTRIDRREGGEERKGEEGKGEEGKGDGGEIGEEGGKEMVADGRVDQPKVVQLVLQEVLADLKQRYFCISGTNTWRNFRKLGQHSQNPSIFAFCKLFPPIPTCMIRTQSAERCTSSCLELRSPHLGSADSPLLYCEQL